MSATAPNRVLRRCLAWAWVVVLAAASGFLAWLWVSAKIERPYRFFHSTDRYCSYIGFVKGKFLFHYDGGPDMGTVTVRDWRFLEMFWTGSTGYASWQNLNIGIDGTFAAAALAVAWGVTGWRMVIRPAVRRRRGRCLRCGYDLAGIQAAVCPECGAARTCPHSGHSAAGARPARS